MTNYTQLYKEDSLTISKEIRRNRITRSSFYTLFNEKGIKTVVNGCNRLKKYCPINQR